MGRRLVILIAIVFLLGCKEEYLPPTIGGSNNFLIVEGIINSGADSTIIKLNRTLSLNDTSSEIPETGAIVLVESKSGVKHSLTHLGRGRYGTGTLPLSLSENYRLKISTRGGGVYESDYVEIKQTPNIDSVGWNQDVDGNVDIRLYTKDITNKTRYYRWDFTEVWQYNAFYDSNLGYNYTTNQIFFRDSTQLTTQCFSEELSKDILLASTSNLTEDRVDSFSVQKIVNGSDKLSVRYSILVKQYALTPDAYKYWQLLRKNSRDLGTIFGTQPTELISNIKCISNPNEPVIGYVSASTVAQRRIFIRNPELVGWKSESTQTILCEPKIVASDSIAFYLQTQPDYGPAYFITANPPPLAIAKNECLDCTIRGGTTKRPSFW